MKGEETMNIEKIKEIIKNKKVQAISGAVAGALIIAVAGTMILHNNNIENKTVAIEKNIEDKTSEENKEELTVENTTQDKEVVENTDEHIHDENCNHDEENSTSEKNNEVVAQNSSSSTNKKESTIESSSDKQVIQTQVATSKNENTNKDTHTHNWVEVYKDVYHAEEGHYENVLVKEAWTESIPVYEEQYRAICNTCGADITSNYIEHTRNHMLNGEGGSYKNVPMQVQVGTNTIKHDAVYEKKWVVDKAAWTEKVLSGYKCNSCGATK